MSNCLGNTCENKNNCKMRGVCCDLLQNVWNYKPLKNPVACAIRFETLRNNFEKRTAVKHS